MQTYETVVETLNALKANGYTIDFNLSSNKIVCSQNIHQLQIDDFEITEVHRFEGNTNPDDEDIIYAIQSKDGKLKGTLMSAYGMYADSISNEMVKKLTMHN
jgi:Fe2+ or Zn2+ uptake regulation protein